MVPQRPNVRRLATLALLKVNYDAGHDHIDMFLPLVLDTARALKDDAFSVAHLRVELQKRHHLHMPTPTLRTVVSRACKRGFFRQQGGVCQRISERLLDVDLVPAIRDIDREHRALAKQLQDFSTPTQVIVTSEDHALELVFAFLEENHVQLILEEDDTYAKSPSTDWA